MYVTKKARGMGMTADAGAAFSYLGDDFSQVPVESDSVTVTASAGTGPLCFSGFLFPWVGRLDGSSGQMVCRDLLAYGGYALPTPAKVAVTGLVGLLLFGAIFGGRR
jgi:hypothetical protein